MDTMDRKEFLSNMLIKLRKEKGLKQKEFAELLNVPPSTFSKWENGITSPDYNNLCNIADKLGVTTDYLLGQTTIRNSEDREKKDFLIDETIMFRDILENSEFDEGAMTGITINIYFIAFSLMNDEKALSVYRKALETIITNIYHCTEDCFPLDENRLNEKTWSEKFSLISKREYESLIEVSNIFNIFSDKAKTQASKYGYKEIVGTIIDTEYDDEEESNT